MTIRCLHLIFHFFLSFLQYTALATAQADAALYLDNKDPPVYLYHFCSTNKNITLDSPYRFNLNTLLSSLSSHATGSAEFYNKTVTGGGGDAGEAVYGLFLCRGDVTPQMCKKCLELAIQKIASSCFYSKESIVWYHECLVRYSNRSFFSALEEWPIFKVVNYSTITESMEQGSVAWVLANTLNEAVDEATDGVAIGEKKFATRTAKLGNQTVHTLVQCSPDLTSGDCKRCLKDILVDIPMWLLGRHGGMVLYPSCSLMFGLRLFYREVEAVHARAPPNSVPNDGGNGAAREGARKVRSRIIIVVVVPFVGTLLLYYFVIYRLRRKARRRYAILKENFGNESATLESLQFDFATIEVATNKFSVQNRIGQGGFGEVYKGTLSNGQEIAVKRLSTSSEQGTMEFKNEILLIAKLQHRNLVTLLGFCLQEHEKILVYEYVPNKSLDYFLFDSQKQILLNWSKRFKIIEGIARAILYLHEHSRLKIIHRDIKPSNVLLDDNMNPKVSDFGMARMVAIDQDQGRTRKVVGTYGYMPPEYVNFGKYSEKSDIFSFGVMVLEIISGKKNSSSYELPSIDGLLTYAWRYWRDQKPLEIMDPNLRESCETEVSRCIQIGLLCVQEKAEDRPYMSRVVSYLNNLSVELPFPREPAFYVHGRMEPNGVAIESNSGHRSANKSIPSSINEMSITRSFPR